MTDSVDHEGLIGRRVLWEGRPGFDLPREGVVRAVFMGGGVPCVSVELDDGTFKNAPLSECRAARKEEE